MLESQNGVRFDYDDRGRLIGSTRFKGQSSIVERYTTDRAGRLTRLLRSDGYEFNIQYNPQGEVSVLDENGARVEIEYAMDGLPELLRRNGEEYRYRYDGDRRLIEISGPARVTFGYGISGLYESITDPRGQLWRYERNHHGEIVAVVDPAGDETRIEIDDLGRVVSIIDAGGRKSVITYDEAGRLISHGPPGVALPRLAYAESGRLARIDTAGGGTVEFTRGDYGPLSGILIDGRKEVSFQSGEGGLESADSPAGTHRYEFHPWGDLDSETTTFGLVTRHHYDELGRRKAVSTADGRTFAWQFGQRGRIDRIGDPNGTQALLTHDEFGRVNTLRFGAYSVNVSRRHDGLYESIEVSAGEEPIVQYGYEYDAETNLVAILGAGRLLKFEYDYLSRLVGVERAGGNRSIGYDKSGNVLSTPTYGTLNYDEIGRLVSADGKPVTHDADGRLTAIDGDLTLGYNALGQVVSATRSGGTLVEYLYDHRGLMVERRKGDEVLRYLYDGSIPIAVYNGDGQRLASIQHVDGSPLSIIEIDGKEHLLVSNAVGTPLSLIGPSDITHGRVDPWSEDYDLTSRFHGLMGFAGMLSDPEIGLVFMDTRVYLPQIGRFTAPDISGPRGGLNLYAYAANSPLVYRDPTGTAPANPYIPIGGPFPEARFPVTPPAGAKTGAFIGPRQEYLPRAMKYLENLSQTAPNHQARRVASETLLLLREKHVFARMGSRRGGMLGQVTHKHRSRLAEVFVDQIIINLKRVHGKFSTQQQLIRWIAGVLVHEVSHSVQRHRGAMIIADASNTAVREFEAMIRQYLIDPTIAGVDHLPGKPAVRKMQWLVEKALMEGMRQGDRSSLTARGLANMIREYYPGYTEKAAAGMLSSARKNVPSIANIVRTTMAQQNDALRNIDKLDDALRSRQMSRGPPAQAGQNAPGRLAQGFRHLLRVAGGSFSVLDIFLSTQDVISGRRSIPRHYFSIIAGTYGIASAIAGVNLFPPLLAAVLVVDLLRMAANFVRDTIANAASRVVIDSINDPNDPWGRMFELLLNIERDETMRHPCGRAINCDCPNIDAGLLTGPWKTECRRHQREMRSACYAAFQNSIPINEATFAGGTCRPAPHGPGARPLD